MNKKGNERGMCALWTCVGAGATRPRSRPSYCLFTLNKLNLHWIPTQFVFLSTTINICMTFKNKINVNFIFRTHYISISVKRNILLSCEKIISSLCYKYSKRNNICICDYQSEYKQCSRSINLFSRVPLDPLHCQWRRAINCITTNLAIKLRAPFMAT